MAESMPEQWAATVEEKSAPRAPRITFSRVMSVLALAVASAALAVSLMHAGPRGAQGSAGQPGSQGAPGAQGPAGQNAPALGYECQELFPQGSSSGTETTMYWPCTPDSASG
jgi:hypothetical protein